MTKITARKKVTSAMMGSWQTKLGSSKNQERLVPGWFGGHKKRAFFSPLAFSRGQLQGIQTENPPSIGRIKSPKMRPKVTKTKTTIPGWKVDTSWTLHLHMSFKRKAKISLSKRAPIKTPAEMVRKPKSKRFLEDHADEMAFSRPSMLSDPQLLGAISMTKLLA